MKKKTKIAVGQAYLYAGRECIVIEAIDKDFALIQDHIAKVHKKVHLKDLAACKRLYQDNY
jgi:ribosomal protein L14E/L6E/L27E